MTKIEEEISVAIKDNQKVFKDYPKQERDDHVAEVAKKYIEKAMEVQRELCAKSISLSSAGWVYPRDSEKIKDWIRNTPLNTFWLKENVE